ncbi:hypothetical protein GZH47_33630 (plasmid) [Paenibacillus rhizovicinus]|uniref:Uncharacterized protein n=1 Tax=Paenibacillus rhizovicinus TaxID=2704463 RepID=A0A6C0PBT1_9BACL|nr:hypothetical protein [Paenibacillus rhizovicinus]QHW35835.1 hypothetical protein GZH47_33630 [Paenibacillus rhizovicinus]
MAKMNRVTRIGALARNGELFFTPCNVDQDEIKMHESGLALQVKNVLYPVAMYQAIDLHTNQTFANFKKAAKEQDNLIGTP